jgi:hypothetical protein
MKNKYEAQALAITMVILVVSTIVAMSMYFRTTKDKYLTMEERASAEALEIADLILDKITLYPIDEVILKISEQTEEPFDYVEGTNPPFKENIDNYQISQLFTQLGIEESIRNLSICPLENSKNEYLLSIKEIDEHTYYEIKSGLVWSLPIKEISFPDDSEPELVLNFAIRGNSGAGFVLTKSYSQTDQYKKYEYEDIENYCYSDDGIQCNSSNDRFLDDNWIKHDIGESIYIDLNENIDGYTLDEVRITAIGATIGMKYRIYPEEYMEGLRMYQLRVSANCYGVFRGKEILIPEKKWHNPLFDYALFNAEGSI